MRVFVTGGTGAIGQHAVPELIRQGHEVTALARTPEKAARLREQGAEPVIISLFDREALTNAFAGHDAVANLASAMPPVSQFMRYGAWVDTTRVRKEGSAAVVDAALAAGVDRLIQESVSMIYRDKGSDWVTEDDPIDHFRTATGNIAAEKSAQRFIDNGGTGTVLRFGVFYGPGAAHSELMFAQARRHVGMLLGKPEGYTPSIHLTDAATAVAAALNAPSGTFNIVDDEPLTKREFADALAQAAGKKMWIRGPGRLALLLGDRATSLTRSLRVSNTRFRDSTDWTPRYPSAREGWIATARKLGA